jgi:putative redox protein
MADVTGKWKEGMAFDLIIENFSIPVDSDPAFGGKGYGPKPKGLMLTALAGCTGMDVVSMLSKMRVPIESFEININAELAETHPKVFTKIHIEYVFEGKDLNMDKIERAIDLSLNDYCAVANTLKHTAEITHQVTFNP